MFSISIVPSKRSYGTDSIEEEAAYSPPGSCKPPGWEALYQERGYLKHVATATKFFNSLECRHVISGSKAWNSRRRKPN